MSVILKYRIGATVLLSFLGYALGSTVFAQETIEPYFGIDMGGMKLQGINDICTGSTINDCEDVTYFYRIKGSLLLDNATTVDAFYLQSQALKLKGNNNPNAELTISNLGLSVSQRLEIYERLWATGKVGFHYWRHKTTGINTPAERAKYEDTGVDFLLGAGIEHRLVNDLEVELGIEFYESGDIDQVNYFGGVAYNF